MIFYSCLLGLTFRRHGRGEYILQNQCTYIGDWRDNKRHGKGLFTWPDGSTYEVLLQLGRGWAGQGRTGQGRAELGRGRPEVLFAWTNGPTFEELLQLGRGGAGQDRV